MALEMILFLIALLPVLWRGWSGWKMGAAVELRYTISGLFALLVSLRYWYQVSSVLAEYIPVDPQYLTAGVCVALFLAGFALASLIVNLNGEIFQNVFRNPLDNLLGLVAGLVSGAAIGCSILLAASVALPGKVDSFAAGNYPLPLDQYPAILFRTIEQNVAHIERASTSHTPLPVMETAEVSPTEKQVMVSWK